MLHEDNNAHNNMRRGEGEWKAPGRHRLKPGPKHCQIKTGWKGGVGMPNKAKRGY